MLLTLLIISLSLSELSALSHDFTSRVKASGLVGKQNIYDIKADVILILNRDHISYLFLSPLNVNDNKSSRLRSYI